MRVDLAYPWQGHQPDDTVEVDDAVGKQLIRDGKARPTPAPEPELTSEPETAPQTTASTDADTKEG